MTQLLAGVSLGAAGLENLGPVAVRLVSLTAADSPYTVKPRDYLLIVDATAGAVTVTLPAATVPPRSFRVIKSDASANAVTVAASAGQLINGGASVSLTLQNQQADIVGLSASAWVSASSGSGSGGTGTVTNVAFAASPYTVVPADQLIVVDTSGGAVVINLPAAAIGRPLTIIKSTADANTVTIVPNGANTINGGGNVVLGLVFESASIEGVSATAWLSVSGQVSIATVQDIDGAAGTNRDLVFSTAGVRRAILRVNNTAESGGDAGSVIQLIAVHDDGTLGDIIFSTPRSDSGAITWANRLQGFSSFWDTGLGAIVQLAIGYVETATTPYAASAGTVVGINAVAGAKVVNLPQVAGASSLATTGRVIVVKKVDAGFNPVTVTPFAGDTVEGAATYILNQPNQSVILLSNGGTDWKVIGSNSVAPLHGLTVADTPFTIALSSLSSSVPVFPVNAAGGAVTVNLPDPTTVPGRRLFVGKTDTSANAVTIATPAGVIGVGGQTSLVTAVAGTWVELVSDGTNWQVLA